MKNIDWHAGFVFAMKLELIENEKDLIYEEEHLIANRAQRIDLLIIKNSNDVTIRNPIFTSANNDLMKEQLEEPTMCKAVNELFADEIKELKNIVADKDSLIATQNTLLADKDALIAKLQAQLEEYANQQS